MTINVLKTMDMADDTIQIGLRPFNFKEGDLPVARAAVAELIAASENITQFGNMSSPPAWRRLEAAIAAVKGE